MMPADKVPRNKLLGLRLTPAEFDLLDRVVAALEESHPGLHLSSQDALKMGLARLARELGVTAPAAVPPVPPSSQARTKKTTRKAR